MPIFFQQDIDRCTKLGIWKIAEEEDFFLERVPLQRAITHPHKRLQHLAGRYLLQYLFPDFPIRLIQIADTRKPFLENEAYHFSISHCGRFAAVIASTENRVGVDLEIISEKVERIRHKFVSDGDERVIRDAATGEAHLMATLMWSCKEAVFKWYGRGQVDFREHMAVCSITEKKGDAFETVIRFQKEEELFLSLHSTIFEDLCFSYVVT
jgi:phosphopantetheinyl transferase